VAHASTLKSLADLAEDQWGLFTRAQAEATGMAWSTLSRLTGRGVVERVAHGVYRLRGVPPRDDLDTRAAWLQLAPDMPVWVRQPLQGVVSHRSAAALLGLGHLPADTHQFTMPKRRQNRRPDVTVHLGTLNDKEWLNHGGILVTVPSRTAADLLADHEDPGAVGQVIADALQRASDRPERFATALAPLARRYGVTPGDGIAMLDWLLHLASAPDRERWVNSARAHASERRAPRDDYRLTAVQLARGVQACFDRPVEEDRQAERPMVIARSAMPVCLRPPTHPPIPV
jgi:predicted transcriptional regulator of viral defense system